METPKNNDLVPYQTRAPQQQQPAKALTKHQRATIFFKAVRYVKSMLLSVGFHEEADCGHAGFTIGYGGNYDFSLEMVVKEPPMMAHVTSYPGYQYDSEKINAKVTLMSPGDGTDYVIQVLAVVNQMTQMPVYLVMRKDSPDLLKEAFLNALMAARDAIRKDPRLMAKIQAELAKKDIEKELEKLKAQDESQALPPTGTKQLGQSSAP